MQLAIIDNYDSFTFNLFQLAAEIAGKRPFVVKNDDHWDTLASLEFDAVIVSPGPGRPDRSEDFGLSREARALLSAFGAVEQAAALCAP